MTEDTSVSDHEQASGSDSRPTVRLATPADIPGMTEVFDLSFDRFPRWEVSEGQQGFLRWLTERHGSLESWSAVSVLDGKIVGVRTSHRRPALVHGRRLICEGAGSGYAAMHPIARGKGFFREFRAFNRGEVDIEVGFSQVPQVHYIRRDDGPLSVANPWTVFACVQAPLRAASGRSAGGRLKNVAGYAWLAARGRISRWRRRPRKRESDWTVSAVERCDERFDDLYERAAGEFDFILQRDHEYLNGRYLDRRGGTFSILAAEAGEELLGYAAVTVVHGRGHIADLLVLPGREDVTRSLIEASLEHCAALGSSAVECTMMLHHPHSSVLRDAGFVRLRARSDNATWRLVFMPLTADVEVLREFAENEHARIHLTEGDSEII